MENPSEGPKNINPKTSQNLNPTGTKPIPNLISIEAASSTTGTTRPLPPPLPGVFVCDPPSHGSSSMQPSYVNNNSESDSGLAYVTYSEPNMATPEASSTQTAYQMSSLSTVYGDYSITNEEREFERLQHTLPNSSDQSSMLPMSGDIYQTLQPVPVSYFDAPPYLESTVYQQLEPVSRNDYRLDMDKIVKRKVYQELSPVSRNKGESAPKQVRYQKSAGGPNQSQKIKSNQQSAIPPQYANSKLYQQLSKPHATIKPKQTNVKTYHQLKPVYKPNNQSRNQQDRQTISMVNSNQAKLGSYPQHEHKSQFTPHQSVPNNMNLVQFAEPTTVQSMNKSPNINSGLQQSQTFLQRNFPEHKPKVYLELREPPNRKPNGGVLESCHSKSMPKICSGSFVPPTSGENKMLAISAPISTFYPDNSDGNIRLSGPHERPMSLHENKKFSPQVTSASYINDKEPKIEDKGQTYSSNQFSPYVSEVQPLPVSVSETQYRNKTFVSNGNINSNLLSLPKVPVCYGDLSSNHTNKSPEYKALANKERKNKFILPNEQATREAVQNLLMLNQQSLSQEHSNFIKTETSSIVAVPPVQNVSYSSFSTTTGGNNDEISGSVKVNDISMAESYIPNEGKNFESISPNKKKEKLLSMWTSSLTSQCLEANLDKRIEENSKPTIEVINEVGCNLHDKEPNNSHPSEQVNNHVLKPCSTIDISKPVIEMINEVGHNVHDKEDSSNSHQSEQIKDHVLEPCSSTESSKPTIEVINEIGHDVHDKELRNSHRPEQNKGHDLDPCFPIEPTRELVPTTQISTSSDSQDILKPPSKAESVESEQKIVDKMSQKSEIGLKGSEFVSPILSTQSNGVAHESNDKTETQSDSGNENSDKKFENFKDDNLIETTPSSETKSESVMKNNHGDSFNGSSVTEEKISSKTKSRQLSTNSVQVSKDLEQSIAAKNLEVANFTETSHLNHDSIEVKNDKTTTEPKTASDMNFDVKPEMSVLSSDLENQFKKKRKYIKKSQFEKVKREDNSEATTRPKRKYIKVNSNKTLKHFLKVKKQIKNPKKEENRNNVEESKIDQAQRPINIEHQADDNKITEGISNVPKEEGREKRPNKYYKYSKKQNRRPLDLPVLRGKSDVPLMSKYSKRIIKKKNLDFEPTERARKPRDRLKRKYTKRKHLQDVQEDDPDDRESVQSPAEKKKYKFVDPLQEGLITDDEDEAVFLGFDNPQDDDDVVLGFDFDEDSDDFEPSDELADELEVDSMTVECDPPTILRAPDLTIECTQCTKSFKSHHELVKHLEEHAAKLGNSNSKTYSCTKCTRDFDTQAKLDKHVRWNHEGGKRFKCPECSKLFVTGSYVEKHIETIHGKKGKKARFFCNECNLSFPTVMKLEKHESEAHQIPMFKCEKCPKTFANFASLERHINAHEKEIELQNSKLETPELEAHKVPTFKCEKCPKTFSNSASLERHRHSHEKEIKLQNAEFPCAYCSEKFSTRDALHAHWPTHVDKKVYTCEVCSSKFSTLLALKRHKALHAEDKLFRCEICQRAFTSLSYLKTHLLIHTGTKRFDCKLCFKKFSRQDVLNTHMWIHTGEKNYQCDICSQKFRWRHAVKSHKLIYHSKEKPFVCEICGKQFSHPDSFKKHGEVHAEKLFYCQICYKAFSRPGSLKIHVLIHSDLKPYFCDKCNKCFRSKGHLRNHFLVHTKEKPWLCKFCNKTYKDRNQLRRHKRVVHCKAFYQKILPYVPESFKTYENFEMIADAHEAGIFPVDTEELSQELPQGTEVVDPSSGHFLMNSEQKKDLKREEEENPNPEEGTPEMKEENPNSEEVNPNI